MSSLCCSNCYTKYSVFNPEEGCSSCAFSFCRKCLPHRALLPHLANKPVSVCSQCYEKLNEQTLMNQNTNGTQITRISIGDNSQRSHPCATPSTNWWGDGLPPPSMRTAIDHPHPPQRVLREIIKGQTTKKTGHTIGMEAKLTKSREDGMRDNVLTLSEIEVRLAALRGCDVELIRRPRCIFESAERSRPTGDAVQGLLKEASDLVEINDRHDPVTELERWHKRLREEGEQAPHSTKSVVKDDFPAPVDGFGTDTEGQRLSKVSTATAFSEATAKELEEINRLMEDAQKRINASEADEKRMEREMKSLLAATRQKSLELEEVNRKIGQFWDKRLEKECVSESEDESVDEETVKKIILEADQITNEVRDDQPSSSALTSSNVPLPQANMQPSPKKAGIFSRIFRR
ncbi:hypothetical protein Angca_009963 [Angiostrongylus cantonensis]|nr:hypothetical protein Angca_009963 [Angiostrongylus cantonensis]